MALACAANGGTAGRVFRVRPPAGDAHAVLQAGLDSAKARGGGIVRLAPGVYDLDGDSGALICRDCRHVVVAGEGDATRLRIRPGSNGQTAGLVFLESESVRVRRLRMEGLLLDREGWANNHTLHGGLLFSHCSRASVDSCSFRGFYTGGVIFQSHSSDLEVGNCRFDSVAYKLKGDYGAISLESGSGRAYLARNRFRGLSHSAISIWAGRGIEAIGNRATFDTASDFTMGIYALAGLKASRIADNEFRCVHNEGIILDGDRDPVDSNRIEGNLITAHMAGVVIGEGEQGCDEPLASGNLVLSNRISGFGGLPVAHGILLHRSFGTRLISNRIDSADRGISVLDCSGGNVARSNRISSARVGLNWTGGGVVTGNAFRALGTGVHCDAFTRMQIAGNSFERVEIRIERGRKAGTITESAIDP